MRWSSFGVFGVVVGCCGLLAVCLPETRGEGINDTTEEEECKMTVSASVDSKLEGFVSLS